MSPTRNEICRRFAQESGYPARLTADLASRGDFEDREWTIELFNVPAEDQRGLLRKLRTLRREVESETGHVVRVLFHTPEATARYYAGVLPSKT